MPNRVLRDWTDSEAVNSLSWSAEVTFTRLIMKVDDYGRFSANPRLLRSLLFPLKGGLRDTDMTRLLAECEKAGLIAVYNIEGKSFLEIRNFRQRTRAEKSYYPAPGEPNVSPPMSDCDDDGHMTVTCQSTAHGGVDVDVFGDEGGGGNAQMREDNRPPPNPQNVDVDDERWLGKLQHDFPDRDVEGELKSFRNFCQRKGTAANRNGFVGWLKKASPVIRQPKPRFGY